jgi:hypothetical protein
VGGMCVPVPWPCVVAQSARSARAASEWVFMAGGWERWKPAAGYVQRLADLPDASVGKNRVAVGSRTPYGRR